MLNRIAADGVVLLHFAFILFVVLGGLLVLKWPRVAWVHIPAFIWGAVIELAGWICPLTPLENRLRHAGNQAGYPGGFIDHYVIPVMYPLCLSRSLQIALGAVVVVVNFVIYCVVLYRLNRSQ